MNGNVVDKIFGGLDHKDKLTLITSVGSFIVLIVIVFLNNGERKAYREDMQIKDERIERVADNFNNTAVGFQQAVLKITVGLDEKDSTLFNEGRNYLSKLDKVIPREVVTSTRK